MSNPLPLRDFKAERDRLIQKYKEKNNNRSPNDWIYKRVDDFPDPGELKPIEEPFVVLFPLFNVIFLVTLLCLLYIPSILLGAMPVVRATTMMIVLLGCCFFTAFDFRLRRRVLIKLDNTGILVPVEFKNRQEIPWSEVVDIYMSRKTIALEYREFLYIHFHSADANDFT